MPSDPLLASRVTEEQAAKLLVTPSALAELGQQDALCVVSYMRPKRIKAGTVFISEGQKSHTDYMVLVLRGDVTVETVMPGEANNLVVSIISAGSLIGEMGVLDGAPRSASCTAASDLAVAVLTRESLLRLIKEKPDVAARLMLAVSKRLADKLRDTNIKLKRFLQINTALQQEIHAIMDGRGSSRR